MSHVHPLCECVPGHSCPKTVLGDTWLWVGRSMADLSPSLWIFQIEPFSGKGLGFRVQTYILMSQRLRTSGTAGTQMKYSNHSPAISACRASMTQGVGAPLLRGCAVTALPLGSCNLYPAEEPPGPVAARLSPSAALHNSGAVVAPR